MEVLNDKVTILAEAAERSEEIDLASAEQARDRARDTLANKGEERDLEALELTIRYNQMRLRVGNKGRRRRDN